MSSWENNVRQWGSVVCISTADFDAPVWTNKQHVMTRVASQVPVLYVESLGLRKPRLSRRDITRSVRRVVSRRQTMTSARPGLLARPEVISPLIIPLHSSRVHRAINRALLWRQLSADVTQLPRPRLLWTYNPVVVDEVPLVNFDTVVYHCVDDLATMPRVSAKAIAETEARLVREVDAVFASSAKLAERLSRWRSDNVHLVHNVADADHFAAAREIGPIPADLEAISKPRALYVGSLNDYKLDWRLIGEVAREVVDWNFVLIGGAGGEEITSGQRAVTSLPNVHILGHRPYGELPNYLRGADATMIPYRLTPHTDSIFPLKTWEYLAAGKHTVATPLPALQGLNLPISFAADMASFSAALRRGGGNPHDESLELARKWTWDALLDRAFSLIPSPN